MPQTAPKGLYKLICLVEYNWNMWENHSNMLQPLTILIYSKVKSKCTDIEQKMFEKVECIVAYNNILSYPDFNKKYIYSCMLDISK